MIDSQPGGLSCQPVWPGGRRASSAGQTRIAGVLSSFDIAAQCRHICSSSATLSIVPPFVEGVAHGNRPRWSVEKIRKPSPMFLRLLTQLIRLAFARAMARAGRITSASIASTARTATTAIQLSPRASLVPRMPRGGYNVGVTKRMLRESTKCSWKRPHSGTPPSPTRRTARWSPAVRCRRPSGCCPRPRGSPT